jgi:glutamate 5-kinase
VREVVAISPEIEALVSPTRTGLGSGGMTSKLAAAKVATASGIPAVIARFEPGALGRIMSGTEVGTLFHAASRRMAKRKAWIAFVAVPRGTVLVDPGARSALSGDNRSLLAAGVRGVRGSFAPGDAVDIADESGEPFARGLVSFSSDELQRIAGLGSAQVAEILGTPGAREVVHRDELVLL